MWIKPAVAGAALVTGLALVVGTGGASTPEDITSTVQVDPAGGHHDKGHQRGHEKSDKPEKGERSGRPDKAEKSDRRGRRAGPDDAPAGNGPPPHVTLRPDHPWHGKACIRPARYEGGPLEACPWTRVEGKVVPVEPRPYSETEE